VIKSALIPVAGHGMRLLPATKSQPKEMLPVGRKPIVQYVVEELVSNGIQQMLFITGRNKASIENHFDDDPELFRALNDGDRKELLSEVNFKDLGANFFYTRQRLQRGLGDAVLCGENFAGEEPFLVALGDSILGLHAKSNVVARLAKVYESKHASCVIAVEEVPKDKTHLYGIVDGEPAPQPPFGERLLRIRDLVEKPQPENAPSNLAITGRYVLPPEIFDCLARTKPGAGNEIQLTDALRILAREHGLWAYIYEGISYDAGDKLGFLKATVEIALQNPEFGAAFRSYLKTLKL